MLLMTCSAEIVIAHLLPVVEVKGTQGAVNSSKSRIITTIFL